MYYKILHSSFEGLAKLLGCKYIGNLHYMSRNRGCKIIILIETFQERILKVGNTGLYKATRSGLGTLTKFRKMIKGN